MFVKGRSGNPNGRPAGRCISYWLRKFGNEMRADNKTKFQHIAQRSIEWMESDEISPKEFLPMLEFVKETLEGKAVSVELQGTLDSPLADMDTSVISERLAELQAKKNKENEENDFSK